MSDQLGQQIEGTAVQWRVLGFLALAELLAMTLWFSATVVVPTLEIEWQLSSASAAWLTMSVQIGFVAGTFLIAFLNLPDLVNSRRLIAASALLGAASNAVFAFAADGMALAIPLRFLTGVFLAGVFIQHLRKVSQRAVLLTWTVFTLLTPVAAALISGLTTSLNIVASLHLGAAAFLLMAGLLLT